MYVCFDLFGLVLIWYINSYIPLMWFRLIFCFSILRFDRWFRFLGDVSSLCSLRPWISLTVLSLLSILFKLNGSTSLWVLPIISWLSGLSLGFVALWLLNKSFLVRLWNLLIKSISIFNPAPPRFVVETFSWWLVFNKNYLCFPVSMYGSSLKYALCDNFSTLSMSFLRNEDR